MKTNELAQSVSTDSCASSVCEACGASFGCGAREATGCWCVEVKLSNAKLAELRERYQNCLCRACLESLAAREDEGPEKIFGPTPEKEARLTRK